MMFGLTVEKLLLIAVVAAFLIGPARLPGYAARLAGLVKTVRKLTEVAKERVREEMGPEIDTIEWTKLDPRQYDPRRIVRDALVDTIAPATPPQDPVPPAARPESFRP